MIFPHLTLGSRWTFVGGKGGVGKTTVASALALELASLSTAVTVISVDPAHSLGDALGMRLGPEPRRVPGISNLEALEVDAEYEREAFFARHGDSVAAVLERGTYLDRDDVRQVSDLALPGLDEMAALLRLARFVEHHSGSVILDTAPSGHTLRLLELPRLAITWLDALAAMEAKYAAVAAGLVGAYAPDEHARFLAGLRKSLHDIGAWLRDPAATRFVLVTTAEAAVIAETRRYQTELERLGVAIAGIVVNRQAVAPPAGAVGDQMVFIPELPGSLQGLEGLRRVSLHAGRLPLRPDAETLASSGPSPVVGRPFRPPSDRRLYLVGGKGGVGKTTVASAIAVWMATEPARRTLLLGVDPAGSLGDVLGAPVGKRAGSVPGVPLLQARQLDATTAWAEFRETYRREVDELFSGLLAGGTSAVPDQEVVERLINLAPPGVDELMALLEVIDLTEDRTYDALVVDTAPTGHLLRLLEMPAIALDWSHAMLRLLLKYRSVLSLTDLGERILALTRGIRSLQATLGDESATWFGAVALPESLSIPETRRLLPEVRRNGLRPAVVLVNRALTPAGEVREGAGDLLRELVQLDSSVPVAGAPLLNPAPTGPPALLAFLAGWRQIPLD
jgi:arsenite-transporting ATPase